MKWFLGGIVLGIIGLLGLGYFFRSDLKREVETVSLSFSKPTTTAVEQPTPEPLVDYSEFAFDSLMQKNYLAGQIKLGKVLKKENLFTSYVFTYQSDGKTISGMANIPLHQTVQGFAQDKFPVIVLLRGYADKQYYHVGLGTEKSANFLASSGFLTLAPDFLGYGYSDLEDEDILKARFYRPVEVLNLLSAISNFPPADSGKIGLWGHSNGGQLALSVLEIIKQKYPTSLWAPVSLDFPQCLLTYLGKEEEVGNPVKEKIDLFLRNNDPKRFSLSFDFDKIKAPFIVHQGTWDELIKTEWTESLTEKLKKNGNGVNFYSYPKENHNFNRYKTTGDTLRRRDLEFFAKELKVQN